MSEPFVGEIRMVGFTYAPTGWAQCLGQAVPISQNQVVFALLGVTYGGNGTTVFNLPDLQGRSPVGTGNGLGLNPVQPGDKAGTESVSITTLNLPSHSHASNLQVAGTATSPLTVPSATNNVLGASGGGPGSASIWSTALTDPVTIPGGPSGLTGNSQPLPTRNPYLGITFIIAMEGIYPSRP